VAQYEEWAVEPAERSWLSRFIAPQAQARPATVAFVLAAAALATFVASLVLDWASVEVTLPTGDISAFSIDRNAVHLPELGLVYVLGMVAMFGLLGAVLPRPDLALRLRLSAAGVGVALVGVVVATTLRLRDYAPDLWGPARTEAAYQPGAICALAAAVLPLVAVWIAARPAVLAARAEAEEAGRPATVLPAQTSVRTDGRRGVAVSAPEPLDLSVTPDR
jgi:hypothetical protein